MGWKKLFIYLWNTTSVPMVIICSTAMCPPTNISIASAVMFITYETGLYSAWVRSCFMFILRRSSVLLSKSLLTSFSAVNACTTFMPETCSATKPLSSDILALIALYIFLVTALNINVATVTNGITVNI